MIFHNHVTRMGSEIVCGFFFKLSINMLFRLVGGVLEWSANHVNINQDTFLGKKHIWLRRKVLKLQGHRFAQCFSAMRYIFVTYINFNTKVA